MNRQQLLGGGAREFIPLKGKKLTPLQTDQNNVISYSLALNSVPPSCASASRLQPLLVRAINNKFSKREVDMKKGFTLAEVLITLGIIGVVAAMTLPTVISNYRKTSVVSQLQKALSLISNVVKMSEAKYGFSEDWEYCSSVNIDCSKNMFEKYFEPELKVIKKCIPTSDECWTEPKSLSGEKGYLSNSGNWYSQNSVSAVLSNGSSVYMWDGSSVSNPQIIIFFDIDGPRKGLATLGGDVFGFVASLKEGPDFQKGVYPIGIYKNGSAEQYYSDETRGCSNLAGGMLAGVFCTGYIQASSWKIPDNYPVKF